MLKVVCDKHKLAVDEYSLRHMDVKTEFALTLTVEESGINECCLVKKDRHSGTLHTQLSPDQLVCPPSTRAVPPARIRHTAGDIFVRPVGESQEEPDELRFSALLGNELGDYRVRPSPSRPPW